MKNQLEVTWEVHCSFEHMIETWLLQKCLEAPVEDRKLRTRKNTQTYALWWHFCPKSMLMWRKRTSVCDRLSVALWVTAYNFLPISPFLKLYYTDACRPPTRPSLLQFRYLLLVFDVCIIHFTHGLVCSLVRWLIWLPLDEGNMAISFNFFP